jgi:DNA-binding GntR family transcriptional regulator
MPVKSQLTLKDQIYDELLARIISGQLPPGSALDERTLIADLSVSRTPFRAAVGSLAKDGLVEIAPYRGFTVRRFSMKEVDDLYQLRRTLESFAIRTAVEHISNAHIAELERILNAAVAALATDDLDGYGRWDREFHGLIAELSGNGALIDMLARLSLQIQMCRVIANRSHDFAERAASERDEILAALRARDADRAARLMDAHIADVQATVIAELSRAANDALAGAPERELRK